jgi:hypothetical protein
MRGSLEREEVSERAEESERIRAWSRRLRVRPLPAWAPLLDQAHPGLANQEARPKARALSLSLLPVSSHGSCVPLLFLAQQQAQPGAHSRLCGT